jgi:MFS transporter, ACS family, D-galactonate transporter
LGAFLLLPSIGDAVAAVSLLAATDFMLCFGSLYWSFPAILAPPQKAGFLGGLMNFAGSSGGVAIPIITGLILQTTGSYTAVLQFFSACAALYIVGTLLVPLGIKPIAGAAP